MKNIIYLGLVLVATACGVVPSTHQGVFEDSSAQVRLELGSQKGIFTQASGERIEAKAQALKFEKLLKAQEGIYMLKNSNHANLLEVYWIRPLELPRKEEGGLIWFRGEVYLSFFDLNKASPLANVKVKTNEILMNHCSEGRVMLDTVQKRWQVGCPEGAEVYRLLRVEGE